ncbi:MAG: ATP-binding cassette domain-containing protein, partial [Oscillospiraceae bacterium]|nr:ATP-binding cassette domain-containing protein [Oscillospiraceae bacterium]
FAGLSEDLLEKSPFDLSGGQKRRVAIAGVIAMEPEVLILDEPSAGLDPAGRKSLLKNIREYHEKTGAAVVMVSHSMDEVAENVDRIIVLANAGVVMSGTPHEVFSRAQELIDVGLNVPQVTQVAMELVRLGVPVDPAVYTTAELRKALGALKKGGRH